MCKMTKGKRGMDFLRGIKKTRMNGIRWMR